MTKLRHPLLWILILAAVLRWVQIDSPPVGRHAWRQSDTASVARNFHRHDSRLLYPQIDWEVPGYVEMEFPIYPWTASRLYGLFGESEALARALSVLGSLVTIVLLCLLVARILNRRTALWSALLYAILPANLFFGRAIMPESWMLAAGVGGLYGFVRWIDTGSRLAYWLALIATTLACLLKPTSLFLGLPLLWLAWQKWGTRSFAQLRLWLFAFLVSAALVLWYGHAYRLGQEYGASFHVLTAAGADKWGTWSLLVDPSFYHRVFVGYLGERLLTWVGWPMFLVGLTLRRRSSAERLFDVWLLAVTIVLLLASGGSYQHEYYSLPLVLPAVVFMSKVFDREWESYRVWLVAALIAIVALSGYRYLGALADERRFGVDSQVAETLRSQTAPEDLLISCHGANPVWLYLADRRGWGRDCDRLDRDDLEDLIARGASYLVAATRAPIPGSPTSRLRDHLEVFYEVEHEDGAVFLAKLDSRRRFEDLVWTPLLISSFDNAGQMESWALSGGSWNIVEGWLQGTRRRLPAEARSLISLQECGVCRLQTTVSLVPPPAGEKGEPLKRQRGAGRSHARAAIDVWSRGEGTRATLTLSSRTRRVGLTQFQNGIRVDSRRIELPLDTEQPIDLELRSDGFEFELYVHGQPTLTAPIRMTPPLAGALVLRPQLGSVRVEKIEVQRERRLATAPVPATGR